MNALQQLYLMVYLAVCLNFCLAFPMWYGHPIFMGTYRRNGDWWGNYDEDNGYFNGWGMHRPPLVDESDSIDMLN